MVVKLSDESLDLGSNIATNTSFDLKPKGSMYGIFTYIWLIYMVNEDNYIMYGSCRKQLTLFRSNPRAGDR